MKHRARYLMLAILNLIGYCGVIAVNALANVLPINGKTTGAVSDEYINHFTPAGFTFSIWGVIYILLALFVIYGLFIAIRRPDKAGFLPAAGVLFFLSCMANMGWIFAWHYEKIALSLLLMLILLGSLIAVYLRLNVGKNNSSKMEKYLVHLTFSVYLGWITIATIANITVLLMYSGWSSSGLSAQYWAVLVIAAGIAIALAQLLYRSDAYFALVVDWSLFGILMKRLSVDAISDTAVVTISIIGLIIITCGIIVQFVRKKVY